MKADSTKAQILDAAIDLFWKDGYHATNMNALSDAAGMNKATVYQHFRSKEAIAIAAVGRALERTEGYVFTDSFAQQVDPLDRLAAIYQRIYESHTALYRTEGMLRGCPFVNIGLELSLSSDGVRGAVQHAFAVFEDYYRTIVTDLADDGRLLHDLPATELARDLQDNMNATLTASKILQDPEAIARGAARARRYLVGGETPR
ncbi:TetR/AcrR family transcriptional regulator [Sulfitobacter sp. S190]|uniref:TetR/AcrR family transcriptional regulator n=1 Tax=Sulfitobacter sp. S190 TaxID=2867022 RepID=UPI0021A7551C|nr:TetR/AcrR family transcriptional regulator [Sulfitobacter sp. S190]UWR21732.1 TetR/AcrR family transcriptional regulator [Sulfitobacter sp. S190]